MLWMVGITIRIGIVDTGNKLDCDFKILVTSSERQALSYFCVGNPDI